MAPRLVLTPLLTSVNPDIYLYRHGMNRGIFTNDPNFQADSVFRIKLVATLKLALLLATYIVYLLRPPLIKL
jgi:hypothetical protein